MTLLEPDEVARRLALPRSRVLAMARGGGLPHIRLGSTYRFPEAALDAWIEARTAYPSEDGAATSTGQRGGQRLEGARPKKAVGRRRHRGLDDRGPADPKGALRIVTSGGESDAA